MHYHESTDFLCCGEYDSTTADKSNLLTSILSVCCVCDISRSQDALVLHLVMDLLYRGWVDLTLQTIATPTLRWRRHR